MKKDNSYIISLEDISKKYRIYNKTQDRLKHSISNILFNKSHENTQLGQNKYYKEHLALNAISFKIKPGRTVGIIGRNGSGKSTLLQIISKILMPTSGSLQVHGQTAALLELGAGFNPEYSGRENIFTNALILGLTQADIEKKYEKIVEFSELGNFIDRPVKTYSSGMYVRLAFSIAINTTAEILIIDEALSVGDEAFQRKCFAKINEFQSQGGTLLFVSHNSSLILELCDEAILLDQGEMILAGNPKLVINQYQKLLYSSQETKNEVKNEILAIKADQTHHRKNKQETTINKFIEESYNPKLISSSKLYYKNNLAKIEHAKILTLDGKQVNQLQPRSAYIFQYQIEFHRDTENAKAGILLKTLTGLELGGASNFISQDIVKANSKHIVNFKFSCNLTAGTYFFNAGVTQKIDGINHYIARCIDILMFKVLPTNNQYTTGTVDFLIETTTAVTKERQK